MIRWKYFYTLAIEKDEKFGDSLILLNKAIFLHLFNILVSVYQKTSGLNPILLLDNNSFIKSLSSNNTLIIIFMISEIKEENL